MGSVIGSYLSNGPLNLKPSTWRDGGRFGEIFLEFDMNVGIFWLVMALIGSVFVLFKCISTPPHSFFGHFSHRSEWQLIKIDYKSLYSRKCTEEDYQTWHLHNQVGKKQRHCSTRRERGRCCLTTGSASRLCPGRASRAWWDRSRFTWSAGQGTTVCWEGTTPESCQPSPASAELMISNGKATASYSFDGHRGGVTSSSIVCETGASLTMTLAWQRCHTGGRAPFSWDFFYWIFQFGRILCSRQIRVFNTARMRLRR